MDYKIHGDNEMKIACTTCKKLFEPTNMLNRKCSRKCYKKGKYPKSQHLNFHYHMGALQRYFQEPIYQFFRLFHDEHLNIQMKIKNRETEVYLKNWI